jgi:hypothetical protein
MEKRIEGIIDTDGFILLVMNIKNILNIILVKNVFIPEHFNIIKIGLSDDIRNTVR